ncbi:sulfurtransferase [Alsobacter soli]|uniref:Sulfurtransferase n=1 Tax=Alsobacter soli TaxID=2109933 RepID=A0A2T1HWC1_9HYPH|nr:sulfurtransferase/chromate resistance protein [Alsobacter soli]PSC05972.1 sulfurtransferase [Alsobacter soli]
MPSVNSISIDKLARLIGTAACPTIVDVRTDEDFDAEPFLVPGSVRRSHKDVAAWADAYAGHSVVVVCQQGLKLSHGVAAWLRHAGAATAESLDGGTEGWGRADQPRVIADKLPPRDGLGRTVWVTRERPKIDRIACPWLIQRFVDPAAVFLYVKASEVAGVASRFDATPFDVEDVFWSHRGELCSFDVMVEELGLSSPGLSHLARIVRAADTDRLDLEPPAAGLLAASLGLSRNFVDDLEQLDAGMVLYDAFYRWCRDATDETHNWPTNRPGA